MLNFSKGDNRNNDKKILKSSKDLANLMDTDLTKDVEFHIMPSKFMQSKKEGKKNNWFTIIFFIFIFVLILGLVFFVFYEKILKFWEEAEKTIPVIEDITDIKKDDSYIESENILEDTPRKEPADITGPIIMLVNADVATNTIEIAWETDEPSTSLVRFGISKAYASSTPIDMKLVKEHSVILDELLPDTIYFYKVFSTDINDNSASSTGKTFKTKSIGPVITFVAASVDKNTAIVSWNTDKLSTSKVQFGTMSNSYSSATLTDTDLTTSHSMNLANLIANTTYYYRVISGDADGNISTSTEATFITKSVEDILDSDKDGLTDLEEDLFVAEKFNEDTDEDGYLDGVEVINLYDPISYAPERLENSGLIGIYSTSTYQIFYPQSWTAKLIEKEKMLFEAGDGEFIQVMVSPNPESISALEWYKAQSGNDLQESEEKIEEIYNKARISGIKVNENAVYLNDYKYIYILSYNLSTTEQMNYPAVFEMMWQSLESKTEAGQEEIDNDDEGDSQDEIKD